MEMENIYLDQRGRYGYAAPIPSLARGTEPISDVFWICGRRGRVRHVLPADWFGCCAPVALSGNVIVVLLEGEVLERKQKSRTAGLGFDSTGGVHMDWAGTPVWVPVEHLAMNKYGAGIITALASWVQISTNLKLINYLWYYQQRFMNYTIGAL